jgi:SAM-dependent methyltransferase
MVVTDDRDGLRDTDRDWERIAQDQPYWGVLSVEDYRGGELSEAARRAFFRTGERQISDLLGFINHHFYAVRLDRVLEFGCGVGRLVIPLAMRAGEVVAVDVSPTMLDICRRNVGKLKLTNVRYVFGDDALSGVEGTFDFVNTVIVLQHIPPRRGMALIERLIEKVRPGGVFAIQVVYARARHFLHHEQPRARFYRRSGDTMIDLLEAREQPPEGTITMYDYDLNEVIALVSGYAGVPLMILPTRDNDHLGVQLIGVSARAETPEGSETIEAPPAAQPPTAPKP